MLPVQATRPSTTTILRCRRRSFRDTKACSKLTGKAGCDPHARLAEPLRLPASPPGPRTDRVDQHAAGDAPPAGANQGLEHLVGDPALVPDVELHQHALAGVVDVLGDRPQDLLRFRVELGHAAGHGGNADQAGAQPVHAAGLRPMLVPRNLRQSPSIACRASMA